MIKFFPSVVTRTVILIMGIALLPVAAADVVQSYGPQDMLGDDTFRMAPDGTPGDQKAAVALRDVMYALGTLGLIVFIQRFFKGVLQTIAVLAGLVIGTLVAWALGDAHFDAVGGASSSRLSTAGPPSASPRFSR
ncbi:MAG: solute carrier family 23 protein [Ornithinimicrobium sp.]